MLRNNPPVVDTAEEGSWSRVEPPPHFEHDHVAGSGLHSWHAVPEGIHRQQLADIQFETETICHRPGRIERR